MTVAQVIQKAERLDGKMIRVRGAANLWLQPSQAEMWIYGGCAVKRDPNERQGSVKGWLALYDLTDWERSWRYDGPRDETGVKISESSFKCEGDYCKISCSPFEVIPQRMYEFVGTLQVTQGNEFLLENIVLDQSRQLVDGKWIPLSNANFDIMFP